MGEPVYISIARGLVSLNCIPDTNKNKELINQAKDNIQRLCDYLPHGSGFDNGCRIDWEQSKPNKMVILTSYHFMNEQGMYSHWDDYKIVITPSFAESFEMKIYGKNTNGCKDYFYEIFYDKLTSYTLDK